jgi:aromatic ring-opening dioxygenase LigB subunit
MSALVPRERIEQTILLIRGHNVMLDSDLAQLYGVTVGRLNEAVKRNENRFPSDFTFQLTKAEFEHLKSQIAISSSKWGGRRHAPYVFTEQGVAMLSSVLRSKRAIEVNIAIMRTFVRLREMISSNKALARRLSDMEKKYDGQFRVVFEAIRELMAEPMPKSRRIGFKT